MSHKLDLLVPSTRLDKVKSWERTQATELGSFLLSRLETDRLVRPIQWETVHRIRDDPNSKLSQTIDFTLLAQLHPEHLDHRPQEGHLALDTKTLESILDESEDMDCANKTGWNGELCRDYDRIRRWQRGQDLFYPDRQLDPSQSTFWDQWQQSLIVGDKTHNVAKSLNVTSSNLSANRVSLQLEPNNKGHVRVWWCSGSDDEKRQTSTKQLLTMVNDSGYQKDSYAHRSVHADKLDQAWHGLRVWFELHNVSSAMDSYLAPIRQVNVIHGTLNIHSEAHLFSVISFFRLLQHDVDLTLSLILHMVHQLGNGLAHLWHTLGTVHGRIKEAHIVVTPHDDRTVFKWVDTDFLTVCGHVLEGRVATVYTYLAQIRQLSGIVKRLVDHVKLSTMDTMVSRLIHQWIQLEETHLSDLDSEFIRLLLECKDFCLTDSGVVPSSLLEQSLTRVFPQTVIVSS